MQSIHKYSYFFGGNKVSKKAIALQGTSQRTRLAHREMPSAADFSAMCFVSDWNFTVGKQKKRRQRTIPTLAFPIAEVLVKQG